MSLALHQALRYNYNQLPARNKSSSLWAGGKAFQFGKRHETWFEVEQNTLGGDFGGEASDLDDSSYKAYESEDDFDSSSDDDLNNDLDYDKYGNKKYPLFNPQTDMRNPILIKGLVFPSRDILKDAVKQYERINRVVTKLTRNDKLRVKAVCAPSCPWTLWASKLNPKDPMDGSWQIKTIVNHHKCSKGLIEAISLLFPNAEARNCARHLYNNFKNIKGFRGQVMRFTYWKAAKATFPRQFEEAMSEMRRKVMTRLVSMREAAEKYPGPLCPRIQKKLSKIVSQSNNIWPIYAGNEKYGVDCGLGNKHVVDLFNSSCSCRKWDLSGIPCKHVVSCMQLLAVSPETYVNTCYTVTTQLNIYSHLINPVKGPMQWEHVRDMEPIIPPIIRMPPGRPKQTRRKEIDKVRKSGSKLSKTGQQANCSKCGKPGHNTRTCKGIVRGNQMASQSSSLQNLNQATSMDNTSSQPPLTQQSSNLRANFRAKLPFKRKYIL
ncbi:hypothetical protein GOBAR_DD10238 [Gossypium barbadense]|nr:hypothetical protein GOBAR_DD10238 [Gossypium barbadense]